jgi:hypothetical protein
MIGSTSLCNLMDRSIEWLKQRVEQYQLENNEICEAVEDFSEIEKLVQEFTSANPLEEIDIGNGAVPRPTFVNKNLNADYKAKLIELLREYVDCFAWALLGFPSHRIICKRIDANCSLHPGVF